MDLWNKVSIRVLGVGPKMYLGASANIILLWILWIFHWMVRTYKTSHVKAWQEEGPYLLVQGFFGPNLKFNKGIRIFAQSRAPFLFPFYLTRKKKYEYWCFRWREYEHVNLIVFKSLRYFFFLFMGREPFWHLSQQLIQIIELYCKIRSLFVLQTSHI